MAFSPRRLSRIVIGGLAIAFALACAAPASADTSSLPQPLKPVAKLDTQRYLGDWNQIAAIPQPFNLICARDTMANYQLIDPSNIRVENTCTTWTNQENRIVGNARVNDKVTGAQLHVSFPGVPTQESKDGPTNYVVTYIADDYSWAFVGSPERTSAFVLSREPAVSTDQWKQSARSPKTAATTPACSSPLRPPVVQTRSVRSAPSDHSQIQQTPDHMWPGVCCVLNLGDYLPAVTVRLNCATTSLCRFTKTG